MEHFLPNSPELTPEIRKPDLQMLMQDLATSQRTLFEERRNADRRIADERERGRWEAGRVRMELEEKLREMDRQNVVLIRTLGRMQEQNDRLREDFAVARAKAEGIQAAPPPAPKGPILSGSAVPQMGQFELSGTPKQLPSFSQSLPMVPIIPAKEPNLGFDKPLPLVEPPGKPTAP